MNKTKIEWSDMTWNPVTGCLHGCPYCYARKIAERFGDRYAGDDLHVIYKETMGGPYPYGFAPTLHYMRLAEPARKTSGRTIFVCSMADLFGDWVPDAWIKDVFKACEAAPQHRYLFLTKNGGRYEQVGLLPNNNNFWYGTTRTGAGANALESGASDCDNNFLSIEPLLAPIGKETLDAIEFWGWVIIGAETGNRKDKVTPKKEWIEEIVAACDQAGIPMFMKDSLIPIMGEENMRREFPWGKEEAR